MLRRHLAHRLAIVLNLGADEAPGFLLDQVRQRGRVALTARTARNAANTAAAKVALASVGHDGPDTAVAGSTLSRSAPVAVRISCPSMKPVRRERRYQLASPGSRCGERRLARMALQPCVNPKFEHLLETPMGAQ
jgi:hypothetical protein